MKTCAPISIYIHIPYCASKCHYCDFVSCVGSESEISQYLGYLELEMELYQKLLENRCIKTIFLGGGTPSLISSEEMIKLMKALKSTFNVMPDAEVSVEANPGHMDQRRLHGYRQSGINRISFGLQARQTPLLKTLGRHHRAEDFYQQVIQARREGFSNINADIIFGVPGQQMQDWVETIEYVTAMNLPHLSCYGLTYEEGTTLYKKMKAGLENPLEEELEWRMYRKTIETLQKSGYLHYEISNYAKPSYECLHNLTYWKNEEYLALGIAAHGYFNGERYGNVENIKDYKSMLKQGCYPVLMREPISQMESIRETLFLGLRLRDGISLKAFYKKHKQSCLLLFGNEIQELRQKDLLCLDGERIKLTERGFDLADQVLVAFM